MRPHELINGMINKFGGREVGAASVARSFSPSHARHVVYVEVGFRQCLHFTHRPGRRRRPSSHMLISTKKVLVIDGIMAEHHRYCSDNALRCVLVALQKNYEHQNTSEKSFIWHGQTQDSQ